MANPSPISSQNAGAQSTTAVDPSVQSLQALLQAAQRNRQAGQWQAAEQQYTELLADLVNSTASGASRIAPAMLAAIHHNRAICRYALRQHEGALQDAAFAFQADPSLWQSGLIAAQSSRVVEPALAFARRVESLFAAHPEPAQIRILYAQVLMNQMGRAAAARAVVAPLLENSSGNAAHVRDAASIALMSRLYDPQPDDTPARISDDIRQFAQRHLQLDETLQDAVPTPTTGLPAARAKRIGILSNLLMSSPVHALGIARLRQWHADGLELVFFNRGVKSDWATDEFKQLASGWLEVAGLDAQRLHGLLRQSELDALYDMGGWMDVEGLKALSIKPCPMVYKWVGGQSCTTGLTTFDGFVSDALQSPPDTAHLYSEPLLLEPASYVTYTPPPYMRGLEGLARANDNSVWGVVSNPAKLSQRFIDWLVRVAANGFCIPSHRRGDDVHVKTLVMADFRYAHEQTRQRIEQALRPAWGDRLTFAMPEGHMAFLQLLASLEGLIDTFPYSCGLTMVEGLHVGLDVSFAPVDRQMFCERHGLAHVLHHEKRQGL